MTKAMVFDNRLELTFRNKREENILTLIDMNYRFLKECIVKNDVMMVNFYEDQLRAQVDAMYYMGLVKESDYLEFGVFKMVRELKANI